MTGTEIRRVQYGCGLCAPDGWISFDISPTLRVQRVPLVGKVLGRVGPTFPANARYGDIVRGLPTQEQSCDVVYCSHVLEHLALSDFRTALRNTYSVLKPGGTFRFVLPDIRYLAEQYVNATGPDASMAFMEKAYLGEKTRPRGLMGLLRSWIGNSSHRWMWDYDSMEQELKQAGFVDIRRAHFGDSGDPAFESVEDKHRWDDTLGVQCRRAVGS